MKRNKILCLILAAVLIVSMLTACGGGNSGSDGENSSKEIVFADAGWDSIQLHNAIAGFIAVEAFGYKGWSQMTASSSVCHEGILSGELDVHMENWTDNLDFYYPDLEEGKFVELGVNFDDNVQGLYVPRYVIEGDAERGIDAVAPDLKTVEDLKDYADIFVDDEDSGMGRIYGSIPGWQADTILFAKYEYYGLDEMYNYFRPGSEAALAAVLSDAYEKGEAIVGYYWTPTWLMGKYDFVLLEDSAYVDAESFESGETAFPSVSVTITASNDFSKDNEDFCAFLKNYYSSSEQISAALNYMQENGASIADAAKWFLTEYDSMLDDWLDADAAAAVRAAIK